MSNKITFSSEAVTTVLKTAQKNNNDVLDTEVSGDTHLSHNNGKLTLLSECVTATIRNEEICLNLPLGLGSTCIYLPAKFEGDVATACLHINTTWGIPTGVKVTISVAGLVIYTRTFGI